MTRGKLITLEGGEGAGKSTLLAGLQQHLRAQGVDLVQTREPGGTPLGEAVRAIVLDPAHRGMGAESELLLMFASRAQLVRECIEPALAAGSGCCAIVSPMRATPTRVVVAVCRMSALPRWSSGRHTV
jgi:dTMP kinase